MHDFLYPNVGIHTFSVSIELAANSVSCVLFIHRVKNYESLILLVLLFRRL